MSRKFCENCGKNLNEGTGTCPWCGAAPLTGAAVDETRIWSREESPRPRADISQETRVISPVQADHVLPVRRPVPAAAGRVSAPPPPAPRRQPPRRGGFRVSGWVAGAAFLLAVLTVILCVMGGVFDFAKGSSILAMPDLLGKTEEQAVKMLETMGVTPQARRQYDNAAEGLVIGQDIAEGRTLKAQEKVGFTVSLGPKPSETVTFVDVPPLYGMTREAAEDLLKAQGLKMVVSAEKYSKAEKGTVIGQEPLAAAQAQEGDYIRVTISLGEDIHILSATAGKGGTIDPKGQTQVNGGASQTYIITPDEGYEIEAVFVDDADMGPLTEYTFEDVKEAHTIYAVFASLPEETEDPEETPDPEETFIIESPPVHGFRFGGDSVEGFSPRKGEENGN